MTSTDRRGGAGEAADSTSPARARIEILFVAFGALAVSLSQSLLVPALPTLPAELGLGAGSVEWLLTATLLVAAIAVPVFGKLADMVGKRLMLLVALGALVVGSLITALTSDFTLLIVGRSIQGLAVAAVPLGISLLNSVLPRERAGGAVALTSAMLGVGGALGLPLAGVVVEYADFHLLFWITAVAGAVAFVGVLTVVSEAPGRTGGRLDVVGTVLLSLALLTFLVPLSEGATWGWTSPLTWGILILSVVLAAVFVRTQTRRREPLVDMTLLRSRPILLTNTVSLIFGFALFASFLGTAPFVQADPRAGYGFGSSIIVSGLVLLPSGLAQLALAPVAARMIQRFGAPVTMAAGSAVIAVGYALRLVLDGQLWQVTVGTTVIGAGVGMGFAALPSLVATHSPLSEIGASNGINSLFRNIGGSIGSAASAGILASFTITVGGTVLPSLLAFRILFAVACVLAVVAALTSLRIPRDTQEGVPASTLRTSSARNES